MEALKIALPYLVAGALWIGLSDHFAAELFPDIHALAFVSAVKGWLYVLVTALLLYWFVRNIMRDIKHHQDHLDDLVAVRTAEYEKARREAEAVIEAQKRTEIELIGAKQDATSANKAKSEFLSRMSHEIRSPLNSIIGLTHIARETRDMDKLMDYLAKIDLSSRHLLSIINDILDISRIEAGKMSISVSDFDLPAALEELAGILLPRFEAKRQQFNVLIDPAIPRGLRSDPVRLKQVLMNLLTNAGKFTPEGGAIVLRARAVRAIGSSMLVEFSVQDNGIGIREDQIGKLFQSFQQADGSYAREYEGSGLGLAISRSIVELMGGQIRVASEEGKGSVFSFSLPFEYGAQPTHPVTGSFEDLRALVVDDEEETCAYLQSLLAQLRVSARTACSGRQALELVESTLRAGGGFDVVFVDWRMPDMDGIETTRAIKQLCGEQTIVVMISKYEWDDVEQAAKDAGVVHFLAKPVFHSSLVGVLSQLRGSPTPADQALPTLRDATDAQIFAGKRILIVEDMQINQLIIREMLRETGAQTVSAADGYEALECYLSSARFDAILMDIQLPNMDGYETTRRIRGSSRADAKTIPILAMTANVFREDIEAALIAGIDDHIGKPIVYEDLIAKLDQRMAGKTEDSRT